LILGSEIYCQTLFNIN